MTNILQKPGAEQPDQEAGTEENDIANDEGVGTREFLDTRFADPDSGGE